MENWSSGANDLRNATRNRWRTSIPRVDLVFKVVWAVVPAAGLNVMLYRSPPSLFPPYSALETRNSATAALPR